MELFMAQFAFLRKCKIVEDRMGVLELHQKLSKLAKLKILSTAL